jgi:hypothetical protein
VAILSSSVMRYRRSARESSAADSDRADASSNGRRRCSIVTSAPARAALARSCRHRLRPSVTTYSGVASASAMTVSYEILRWRIDDDDDDDDDDERRSVSTASGKRVVLTLWPSVLIIHKARRLRSVDGGDEDKASSSATSSGVRERSSNAKDVGRRAAEARAVSATRHASANRVLIPYLNMALVQL